MNRADLILQLAERHPQLTVKDVDVAVRVILGEMSRQLAKGGRIEMRGFGSFELHHRPARKGRNPKTGESVTVPPKPRPHFKPGKELRERVGK